MILTNPFVDNQTPRYDVETILRRHGVISVLLAFGRALLTGSHRNLPDVEHLPDHLWRDIGLEAHRKRSLQTELLR